VTRAIKVRGIKPKQELKVNARLVVATRLEELLSWRTSLEDARLVRDLHDMRISAKRLRYALEMFDVCFPDLDRSLRDLTELQEFLGDIHDLDVLADLFRARMASRQVVLETRAAEIMGSSASMPEKSASLRQLLSSNARDKQTQGVMGLLGEKIWQRQRRFERLQKRWGAGKLDQLALNIHQATNVISDTRIEDENAAHPEQHLLELPG
jgi:CHAD domain-containing protein